MVYKNTVTLTVHSNAKIQLITLTNPTYILSIQFNYVFIINLNVCLKQAHKESQVRSTSIWFLFSHLFFRGSSLRPPFSSTTDRLYYFSSATHTHTNTLGTSLSVSAPPFRSFGSVSHPEVDRMPKLIVSLPHTLCSEQHHLLPWHFSSHSTNCSQIKPLSHPASAPVLREIWWPGNKTSNLLYEKHKEKKIQDELTQSHCFLLRH